MRFSSSFTAALSFGSASVTALAIPSTPHDHTNVNLALRSIAKVALANCDLSKTVLPTQDSGLLPSPSANLTLKYALLGRGTQNYTCAGTSPSSYGSTNSSAPTSLGAVATLYDASCLSSYHPQLFALLPSTALSISSQTEYTAASVLSSITNQDIILGEHFFSDSTTAVFDLSETGGGVFTGSKVAAEDAPEVQVDIEDYEGQSGAVAWLQLKSKDPYCALKVCFPLSYPVYCARSH